MNLSYGLFFKFVKFLNLLFLFSFSKYPADVSYLVSDFKYSQEHGLKICEVQHGALSSFDGDVYLLGEEGSIVPNVAAFFAHFPMKKWAAGWICPPLKKSLKEWDIHPSMNALLKDPGFLESASSPPMNPFSIASYRGIVYAPLRHFNIKAYPGILFIDAATLPYWRDKYKMNALFEGELKQYKADWKLYLKKYDPLLAERIQEEMPAEFYVIKPRSEMLANGVIVVENKDLDGVLQLILEPSPNLEKHPDKKYSYWWKNKDDTFLIEKYYESDLVRCSEYHYDATLRLAFILQYDEGTMSYHCLGGFWKLPSKALEEEGTLNEKRISCCKPPFYKAIDPELFAQVNAQMERAMLLLYQRMLKNGE